MYFLSLIICFSLYLQNRVFCFYDNNTSRVSGNLLSDEQTSYKARIMGGKPALIEAYPYNVFIELRHKGTCGGAILGPKHVISAGQCYEEELTVYVGSDRKFMGKRVKASKVVRHPEYYEHSNTDGSTYVSHNMMMIELEEMLTPYGPSVRPVVLGSAADYGGASFTVLTGYGNTQSASIVNTAGGRYQRVDGENIRLHKVMIQIFDTEFYLCNRIIKNVGLQCCICAGNDMKDMGGCVGDTGSPLVHRNKLIGLSSRGFNETKCERGIYLYAKVACALGWINSFLKTVQ